VSGPTAVVSHESAAILHGVWVPSPGSTLVHLTTSGKPDRQHRGVRCHESRLGPGAVTVIDGLRVTTLPRTAVDLARGRRLPEALVAVDGVARALLEPDLGADLASLRDPRARAEARLRVVEPLLNAYESVWSWPGSVVVRDAVHLVEPASESPFESRSRGWMAEARLPRPEVAFAVQGRSGRWYYADFAWPEHRVLGEADGLGKFGRHPGDVARRLRDERTRQRDLEDAGWSFVRWDSSESPRLVVTRIRAALLR
jgi:very-short-patch-repair endonuclease